MELMAMVAMIASLASLFLHGYTVGRFDRGCNGRRPIQQQESAGDELNRSEKLQEGMDNIMSFEAKRGFMGVDE